MIARVHSERAHAAILTRLAISAVLSKEGEKAFSEQIRDLIGE